MCAVAGQRQEVQSLSVGNHPGVLFCKHPFLKAGLCLCTSMSIDLPDSPNTKEVLKLYLLIKGSNYQGKLSLSACPSRQLLKFIHPMTVLPSNCPLTTHSRCLSKTRSLSEAAWKTMWRLFHKNQFSVLLLSLILTALHAPFVLPSMEVTHAMY